MQMAAVASGAVDHTQSPRDLARLLCGLRPLDAITEPAMASEDPALETVLRVLRDTSGIDFSLYKLTTVGRRIQSRVDLTHGNNLADYARLLANDRDGVDVLYQDLLIGVTQFFRDPAAFEK